MSDNRSNALQIQLTESHQLIQQGQSAQAIDVLTSLLKKAPTNPDVPHLLALAYKAQNQFQPAEQYFVRSLNLNAAQPQLHNNFANLLMSAERFTEAEKHYKAAIKLQKKFPDAERNLAICFGSQGLYEKAREVYLQLIENYPGVAKLHTGLADSYRNLEEYDAAIRQYQTALNIEPTHPNALHNLGLTFHLQGELSSALDHYRQAYEQVPSNPKIVESYANAMHESGETEMALSLLNYTLERLPEAAKLHERLNELLWESEERFEFGASYVRAIEQRPDDLQLRVSQAAQLFRAQQIEQTVHVAEQALEKFPQSHELLSIYGQALADLGRNEDARELLQNSISIKFSKDAAYALAKLLIIEGDYIEAQDIVNQLLEVNKDCQLTWALQSLVWRLTDNPKYQWLCDYDQFVKPHMLTAPQGYSSLEEFLSKLREVLLSLHRTTAAPLEQTLRGGTQTAPRLLHNPIKELQELKQCLSNIVQTYIEELPDDATHPLLSRKSSIFDFSGSWSVRLRPDGFHVNHVHPAGWISSSCYVSIPHSMTKTSPLNGAIKFGESPLSLGDREVVEKVLHPQPGLVVLFPSYMWHGTYSFVGKDDEYRLTAPFDVEPLTAEKTVI